MTGLSEPVGATSIVCNGNQVLVSGTKTKVQFRYQYLSGSFFSETKTETFFYYYELDSSCGFSKRYNIGQKVSTNWGFGFCIEPKPK